jgi:hypothetical protein
VSRADTRKSGRSAIPYGSSRCSTYADLGPIYSVRYIIGAREISGSWFPSAAGIGQFLAKLDQIPANLLPQEHPGWIQDGRPVLEEAGLGSE